MNVGKLVMAVGAGISTALLASCSLQIPADPNGTLDRVTDGEIRIGVTHNPPRVDLANPDQPSGIEVDLATEFAEHLDAEITWVVDSEANLAKGLEAGTLDMAVAGFHDDTPWASVAGMTRSCLEGTDQFGSDVKYVLLVPLGENEFLVALENFVCGSEISS